MSQTGRTVSWAVVEAALREVYGEVEAARCPPPFALFLAAVEEAVSRASAPTPRRPPAGAPGAVR